MTLPTASEINVYDTLDERAACKNYLGKSLVEVRQMLASGIGNYWEDLAWMGPKAFQYYLPTVIAYVQSKLEARNPSVFSEYLCVLQMRLGLEDDSLRESKQILGTICQQILTQLPLLDPEEVQIYCFRTRIAEVISGLDALP